jgi:PAS domain S-box-containing protein
LTRIGVSTFIESGFTLRLANPTLFRSTKGENPVNERPPIEAAALEFLPTAVYACDAKGRIRRFNAKAAELWGRRPDPDDPEERFCGARRLFFPDGRPMAHADTPMAEALRTGRPIRNAEAVIERPDGSRVPVLVNIDPVFDESGELAGAVNSFLDASELKSKDRSLQARTQELEKVMESVPAIVWIAHDPDCRLITGNRAATEFLRLRPGANHSLTAPVSDAPRHFRVFRAEDGKELVGDDLPVQAAAQGRAVWGLEEKVVFDDGDLRYLYGNAVPLPGPDGKTRGSVAAFVDVTDQKRKAEREKFLSDAVTLLSQSLDYETTLSKVAELAVRRTADWCAVYVVEESAAVRPLVVLHRDPEKIERARELIRRYPYDPDSPHGIARVIRTGRSELFPEITDDVLRRTARSEEHYRALKDLGMTSGLVVPLRVHGRTLGALTLIWDAGRRYGAEDVSLAEALADRAALAIENARLFREAQRELRERQHAEEEVRRLNADLERGVRERTAELQRTLEELEAFTYTVAHDLRSPLRAMHSFGQMLLEDYGPKLDATAREYLSHIVGAGSRMDTLITDLLAYSRLNRQQMPLQRTDLETVVEQVLRGMSEELRSSGAEVRVERPLPSVQAHAGTLGQAIGNLVSNAAKFVSAGTKPRIVVRAEPLEAPPPGSRRVRLWIEDNGIGIAPEHRGRLFKVFERLHGRDAYPGTGIGLAIVRRAAERMGGGTGVESVPGEGSRFFIDLNA